MPQLFRGPGKLDAARKSGIRDINRIVYHLLGKGAGIGYLMRSAIRRLMVRFL
jgi:hypothetical protein